MTLTLPDRVTANEVREALTNIAHTLTVLRAIGGNTEGVMRYADHILDARGLTVPRNSGNGQPLVYIDPDSIKSLRQVQAILADHADGARLSRQLNKRLTAEARKIQMAQRKNAGNLEFASKGSSGTSRFNRSDRVAGVTKKGKKRSGKTLRDEMASTIRVKVSKDNKGGSGAGVRIVQSSPDKVVNKIARRLNRKGFVRHPLFGDTDHWYNTTATNGIDWFWTPFAERRDEIRRGIAKVLDDFTKELARDIDRKA